LCEELYAEPPLGKKKRGKREAEVEIEIDYEEILLEGVRGEGKAPGDFRKTPNWIGPTGCTIDEARYVPIGAELLNIAEGRNAF
jgi:hypothetical protein